MKTQAYSSSALPALKKLDRDAAVRGLMAFLKDEEVVSRRFPTALWRLRNADYDLRRCGMDPPPTPQALAMNALAELGASQAIPLLRQRIREGNRPNRAAAAHALISLATPGMAGELIDLLRDGDSSVRIAAMDQLARLGSKEALPALLALLQDPELRSGAISACGRIGGAEVLPSIRPLLDDRGPWVRTQAASWLCRLGDRGGRPLLLREGRELSSLNAIRCPGVWQRLLDKRLSEPLQGTLHDLLARIAVEAGLELEIPEIVPGSRRRDLAYVWRISPQDCPTLLDALIYLSPRYGSQTFILEEGRLRLLGGGEAWKFWEEWAAPSGAASPAPLQRR
jgi:HEAT repeat protein